ncbi:MAG: PIG-L family deacetylase, partial [Cellulomonas sp.]
MDRLVRAALDAQVSRRELLAMLGVVPFVIFAAEPSSRPATHRSTVASNPSAPTSSTPAATAARALTTVAGPTAGGAMQVVAHQDDDLLFQSPDLLHDVAAGRPVRTVFVTAGDAARDRTYWTGRERGSMAAYARMAGVADRWTTSDAGVPGTPIRMHTLVGAPHVSLVFMRLPDGNRSGTGMMVHHHESLMRLWRGDILTIHAVDGTASYSAASLRHALTTLMSAFQPTTVRTQDWTIAFGTGDNADHTA